MVQHTDMLDSISPNQVILDNRLTRLQTFPSHQFTKVHQNLGDLIHTGSLSCQCALKSVLLLAAEQAQSADYAA